MPVATLLPNSRSAIAFAHDIFAAALAWYVAFLLRFNFELSVEQFGLMKQMLWVVMPIQAFTFLGFGLYRGTWRFASVPDLKRILLTVFASAVFLVALLFMLNESVRPPRSVLILYPLLLVLGMGGSRFVYRAIREHQLYGAHLKRGEPVLVVGAGTVAIH